MNVHQHLFQETETLVRGKAKEMSVSLGSTSPLPLLPTRDHPSHQGPIPEPSAVFSCSLALSNQPALPLTQWFVLFPAARVQSGSALALASI